MYGAEIVDGAECPDCEGNEVRCVVMPTAVLAWCECGYVLEVKA